MTIDSIPQSSEATKPYRLTLGDGVEISDSYRDLILADIATALNNSRFNLVDFEIRIGQKKSDNCFWFQIKIPTKRHPDAFIWGEMKYELGADDASQSSVKKVGKCTKSEIYVHPEKDPRPKPRDLKEDERRKDADALFFLAQFGLGKSHEAWLLAKEGSGQFNSWKLSSATQQWVKENIRNVWQPVNQSVKKAA